MTDLEEEGEICLLSLLRQAKPWRFSAQSYHQLQSNLVP